MPTWVGRKKETTRSRSKRQEDRIASMVSGRTTINSGATFGQNDVVNKNCEFECKTTGKSSYSIKVVEWKKLVNKCNVHKLPIEVIEFEKDDTELAIIQMSDLVMLLEAYYK